MATYYEQITGAIRSPLEMQQERLMRQSAIKKLQEEQDLMTQRKNILQQFFQPAVAERQELAPTGGNPLEALMQQQQPANMVEARMAGVGRPSAPDSMIPGYTSETIPGKKEVFDPRGAMGALFGIGDFEGGRAVSQIADGSRQDQYGTSGDLIRLADGSLVRRQYSTSGQYRDIPIQGELTAPLTQYQTAELGIKESEQKRKEEESRVSEELNRQRLAEERKRREEDARIKREELELKRKDAENKPTGATTSEGERQAAGFHGRMTQSSSVIDSLESKNKGLPTVTTNVTGALLGDFAQRKAMTKEQQQYKNAADAWIRAKLRKESGAVIGEEEAKAEYRTYFPVPGDTPEVIAQKSLLRKEAEQEMRISAGRAFQGEQQARPQQSMQRMPPASQHTGKVVRDTASGVRYKSDGSKWVRIQ